MDKGGSYLLPPTAHSEPRKGDSGGVTDLTKVLFQTSYDERMRKVWRESVVKPVVNLNVLTALQGACSCVFGGYFKGENFRGVKYSVFVF